MQDKQNSNLTKGMANDSRIFDICEIIGEQFGLHIDQVSELDSEIRGIFLGINKSEDFIGHIISRLEIDKDLAQKIANEVSAKIYIVLKEKIQSSILNGTEEIKLAKPSHITDLEKAGGFTIEHDMGNREAGLGSEDLRAMPMRDKWSPFGQTIFPTPSKPNEAKQTTDQPVKPTEAQMTMAEPTKPTVEASPVITKTTEAEQAIPKSNNIPTEPPRQTPIIIKTTEAKESFIKEPIISKPAVPVVEEPIQKTTEVIEQKVETKIEPEVEVKEEVVVSTVPDNLPVEPAVTKTEEKLPIKEAASSAQATETKVEMKVEKTVPKATEELTAPTEPQGNSLAETIINLRRIKDATPKPQIEQTPIIEQPTKSESNTIKEQTPPPQPAPELIVPEKIKLNPGIPKPIEQQRPRSSDPYREPVN